MPSQSPLKESETGSVMVAARAVAVAAECAISLCKKAEMSPTAAAPPSSVAARAANSPRARRRRRRSGGILLRLTSRLRRAAAVHFTGDATAHHVARNRVDKVGHVA